MKFYGCDKCMTIVRVHGDPDSIQRLIVEHSLWKDGMPCVRSDCDAMMGGVTNPVAESALRQGWVNSLNLTAEEFFQALCGFGLPEEIGSDPEVVRALLLSAKVSDVSVHASSSGKTVLDRVDLDNGTSLHLAPSSRGAVVFKVTRRRDVDKDNGAVREDSQKHGVPVFNCGGS